MEETKWMTADGLWSTPTGKGEEGHLEDDYGVVNDANGLGSTS
jgi:hypothetical protein